MTETWYDVVVIGAGPVGENVADTAVKAGLTAVIVESELVGGECSYWACMPSKALLRSGLALEAARSVAGAREAITGDLDVSAVLARRDSFTSEWNDQGQVSWLESAGIDLVRGHGRLAGEKKVEVETAHGTVTLLARQAVALCTGSAALLPPITGIAEADPWTSREATAAETIPDSLVIIGGGVVAVEMATAYSSLGSDVTVLVRGGALLGGHEDFAGDAVAESLRNRGVTIVAGSASEVTRDTDGQVHIDIDGHSSLVADEILVATGRVPRTDDLGLDTVGLTPGDWLTVDDTLSVRGVDGRWLYAIGDVNHRALLTHQGKYQARAAGAAIAARASAGPGSTGTFDDWTDPVATADARAVPAVVFSSPEVASVGLTSTAASDAGLTIRVVDYDLGSVAGASLHADGYAGHVRAVIDEDRGILVGMTFVGNDVAELLHAATIAIVGEVPLSRLWHAVPAYPTLSEVWLRILETYRASA